MPLLEINNLSVSFTRYYNVFQQETVDVITNLQLSIEEGEVVAVVGASGAGKSLMAHAILGILPRNAKTTGTMRYRGELLTAKKQSALRGKEIALVPQSVSYLNPLMQVGKQVRFAAKRQDAKRNQTDDKHNVHTIRRQREAFAKLQLPKETEAKYPFELSGGMARRVLLSTAVVSGARLIVADEPTPGLHPEILTQSLDHLRAMANEGSGIVFITHDIDMALRIADKIAVFYAGTIVEIALARDFSNGALSLRHPFSKALWKALPHNEFKPLHGTQPLPGTHISGCLFAPRCELATVECSEKFPPMRDLRNGLVRCLHAT